MKILKKDDIPRYFKAPSKIPIVRLRQVEHALRSRPKPEAGQEPQAAIELPAIQPLPPLPSPWVISFQRGADGRIDGVVAQQESSGGAWAGAIQRDSGGRVCAAMLVERKGQGVGGWG